MEIKDFIKETLLQIVDGVSNANNALNKTIKKYNVINIKVFDQVSCFKKNRCYD